MKKISMKILSGFISMIMMANLIMPVGVYASVVTGDDTVIEETVADQEEETLNEQFTTASGTETVKNEEENKEEENLTETETTETDKEEISKAFSESKTIGDVTITVKAEAGAFPDDSYLEVKEIASDTDMSSDTETLVASYSYDITIYDKDGNEIEPAEGKNVTVSFSMEKISDSNLDTNIYHTSDDGTVTELNITTSGDTATATTDSFSVYTVEFTYGELTYVLNGDDTIKLSDILNSVSLTGEATDVECSDTSLFSASNESGEWIISSHKAFSTTEWMKVTIEDVVYEIKVTDSNNIVKSGNCGANGNNVTWTLDDEGTFTISGTGAMKDYYFTDERPWDYDVNKIKTVTISDGVTSIGNYAFEKCSDLSSITIPSGVTSIGDRAFYNCENLSSITIPSSVTSIGNHAFDKCTSLSSITIPTSVTSIGRSAFNSCSSLSSITIPASVTSIEQETFKGCSSLSSITIPSSVTRIGVSAFQNCSNLSSITIPSSVTSIGQYAFANINANAVIYYDGTETDFNKVDGSNNVPASKLKFRSEGGNCGANGDNVKWSYFDDGTLLISGTGAMKDYAYENEVPWRDKKHNIQTVTIFYGVTSIGNQAFSGLGYISITIPNSVTSIGSYAFYASPLSSITLPESVTSIGDHAFCGTSISSITIPASVTSIADFTFQNCSELTSIDIPASVTNIGLGAFIHCSSLSSIIIPDGVTSIGSKAFWKCNALSSITIPASVTSIDENAFLNMGSNATDPTITFGGTKARWDAFDGASSVDTSKVTVNCTKLDITITAKDQSVALGGTVSETVSDVTMTGSLDTGHTLEGITLTADTSNATTNGTIVPSDVIIKQGDTVVNIADNYNITYAVGKLTVTKGNPAVTAPKAKTGLVYDGTEQELISPGSTTGGTLKYSLSATGTYSADIPKAKDAGPYTVYYKVEGNDNYNGDNGGSVSVSIGTKPITITADSASKAYDGIALTKNSYTKTDLASGDNITSVTVTGSQTVLGSSDNVPSAAVIKNAAGVDVTSSYNITYANGTLKVNKKDITITADSADKTYDGTALTKNGYTNTSLAVGDSITSVTVTGSQTLSGSSNNVPSAAVIKNASNVDVTSSYNITYANGNLTVGKKDLTITADSDTKIYDGTALTKNGYTSTSLAAGDSITSVTITGSQTVYGNSNNVPSAAVIKNAAGANVTSCYNITYTSGTLNVTKRDVTVSVADKAVSYNASEQTGNTSYTFANVAAGDTASITYTPAKGTDASATAYDNGSYANDFKVMSGSTDVTASYNLKAKTAGKLTINKASITPTVTINGWIVGKTANTPKVTGNIGNGTVTIEYKKSSEADTAYTAKVPTELGTYTVRATIDETANSYGATATAEFKISAQPVESNSDSDKKDNNDEDTSTPEETGYEIFMKDLNAAAKKGTPQTLTLNWGNSISYEAMQILKDNPQLTLIFNYKWQGADYSTTIGGGRTVHANKAIPWYGPENLRGLYGATYGRRYANSTGNTVTNTVNTPNNGVYVVQGGDSLWKIAHRKLHVSVDYLVQKNNIRNRNRIRTGQVLYY